MKNNLLRKTFERIEKYLEELETSKKYLNNHSSPKNLADKIDIPIQEKSNMDILPLIDSYLENSVKTGSKHFYNQLFGGINIPAILGEFITTVTNTSMYTYEVAPLATLLEKELINEFCRAIGYSSNEGIFVTGGSNSNMLALLIAQYKFDKTHKYKGNKDKDYIFFVSEESHYSYDKAAIILGIGLDNIIKIKSDSQGAIIPEELEKAILNEQKNNKNPFFVGLTAGTTVRGAFDPIPEIVNICKKYNLWSHIDGSWGGSLLYSNLKTALLKGCENADSFSIDAHKMLGVPLICSAIMFKEKGFLYDLNNISGMDYLLRDEDDINYNLGNFSLQCGRRVDALKLWFTFKYFGREGIRERINHLILLSQYTSKKIENDKNFELISQTISLNICFRFYEPSDSNQIAEKRLDYIRKKLMTDLKYLVNTAHVNDKKCFRLIIVNPDLNKKDIDGLLKTIKNIALCFKNEK